MAEDDQTHDEYQLADLDGLTTESIDETEPVADSAVFPNKKPTAPLVNVKRNGMIAVSILILIIVVYKFISSHSEELKKSTMTSDVASKSAEITPQVRPISQAPDQLPVVPVPVEIIASTNITDSKISQKLSALELTQQSMREDFVSVNNQLGGINSNVNELMTKMAEVSRVVASLNAMAEAQSREIERMVIAKQKAIRQKQSISKLGDLPLKYYVQAVIPGRAWLAATNGSTITVREGSPVSGYGIVKLIDAVQGRVMTSSGQMIRFSQADS